MTIDTELEAFIEDISKYRPKEPGLDIASLRQLSEDLVSRTSVPYPDGMEVENHTVQSGNRDVEIRIYRPGSANPDPQACLMFMHGGGWVIGSIDTHDTITAAIAEQASITVVSVHYARAPEHPYPAAVEDCHTVLEWLFENSGQLNINPRRIFAGGDSAGANLATVMALRYPKSTERALCGQVLVYPCVDTDFSRSSYVTEADAPYLTADKMIWFWEQYCPDAGQRQDPAAVPMRADDLAGMAPALVMVAEHDPLHDEGEEYARRLQEAGVVVAYRPGKGLIHGHLRARNICRAAGDEFDALCNWLRARSQ